MLIKGYSDLSVKTPDCFPGIPMWSASFKLDADVTYLFPYINAVTENTIYTERPHCIQFNLDGFKCALYPDKAIAVPFADREQALNFIKRLIDFLNDLDSRKDSIEPNHKTHKYIPVLEIFKLLPQSNCKQCGFPTCMAFASALSKGEAILAACSELKISGSENAPKLHSMLSVL